MTFANQRITTRIVLPKYQNNMCVKLKYVGFEEARKEKEMILITFKMRNEIRRNRRLFRLVLKDIGVDRLRIRRK